MWDVSDATASFPISVSAQRFYSKEPVYILTEYRGFHFHWCLLRYKKQVLL